MVFSSCEISAWSRPEKLLSKNSADTIHATSLVNARGSVDWVWRDDLDTSIFLNLD